MKKTTLRHIIISLFKTSDKGKILKAAREKKRALHTETKIRTILDFLLEIIQVRRQQSYISKVLLKEENCQSTIPHPGKIPLKSEVKESFFFFF